VTARRRTFTLAALTSSAAVAHADSAAADGAAEVISSSTVWPLLLVIAGVPTAVAVALLARTAPDADRWPLAARFLSSYTLVIGVANVVRSLDWFSRTPSGRRRVGHQTAASRRTVTPGKRRRQFSKTERAVSHASPYLPHGATSTAHARSEADGLILRAYVAASGRGARGPSRRTPSCRLGVQQGPLALG
jgi:hypothetical protein